MKQVTLLLLLGLLATACQNTPKNASEYAQPEQAGPPPASLEEVQQTAASLSSSIQTLENLRKEVDALPEKVRAAKKAEIETYYSTIEGMLEKQTRMLREMQAATAAPSDKGAAAAQDMDVPAGPPSVDLVNDCKASVERYAKEAQAIQETVKQWAGGKQ
jgi:hypothetical protein